jgi:hypothetical protein
MLPSLAVADEHRSRAVAREFQRLYPCPSTGQTSGACPVYWKDHIVPLACGGPDTIANLQWQTIKDARAKDTWERKACASGFGPPRMLLQPIVANNSDQNQQRVLALPEESLLEVRRETAVGPLHLKRGTAPSQSQLEQITACARRSWRIAIQRP